MNRNRGQLKVIRNKIYQIKTSKIDIRLKIMLIQSLSQQLKMWRMQPYDQYYYKTQKSESQDTFFTDYSREYIIKDLDVMELQNKILQKRRIKFELNEEIQTIQDDLFEQQKVIETKRQFSQEMNYQINVKATSMVLQLENNSLCPQKQNKEPIKKSNSVSSLFKKIFS